MAKRVNGKDPSQPGTPGQVGRLHLRADGEDGPIEVEGDYHYVGRLDTGALAFTPATDPEARPIYLHDDEVVSFRERREQHGYQ